MARGSAAFAYVLLSVLITLSGRVCAQPLTATVDVVPACGTKDGSITVNASGGTPNYIYKAVLVPGGGGAFQVSPTFNLAAGTYDVTVQDASSPIQSYTVSNVIIPDAAPTMNVTPTAATCANNDGVLEITGGGGSSPYKYNLDGGSYGDNGTFDHLTSGNHDAYVKDSRGCEVKQTVTVPLNNNLTITGGPDVPLCEGKTAVIPAVSNGTSFSWQPAAGLDNAGILQPTVTATGNTTYTLTASFGACQQTGTFNILVSPAPIAIVQPGRNICSGATIQLQGSGGGTYSWTPADHLDNPNVAEPFVTGLTESTTYHLTVTDANGCQSQNPTSVIISITQPPRVAAASDTIIQLGQSVILHGIDVDNVGLAWQWNPSTALNNDGVQNPVAQPQENITYTVTGRTYNGCEGKASVTVRVYSASGIFMPNAFTPNADGYNDVFRPIMLGLKELKYFAVFDRWGQRVFYSTNLAGGWKGTTAGGQDMPAGTYVWMLGAIDDKGKLIQQKGTVQLIR